MAEIKQPQDRKPKVAKFTFEHDGKTYSLPLASDGAENVAAKFTRDAIMDPDDEVAQLRLGIALLENSGVSEDALAALYAKPTAPMLEVLGAWMQHGDGEGATVPQS